MTIIESFEKAPIENMISTLTSKPEKVIFLGEASQMTKAAKVYQKILDEKGITTKIVLKGIQKNNLQNILHILEEIVAEEEEILFDATGGEELVLLAFGIIYERYKKKKAMKMQRFNINTGRVIDCDADNEVSFEGTFKLDVKELISLYGGIVVPESPQPLVEKSPDVVNALWELAKKDSAKWNRVISFLKELEKKGDISKDILERELVFHDSKILIADYQKKYDEVKELLTSLEAKKVIQDLKFGTDRIHYKFKNEFVKRCLIKAGDALEMKSLLEAISMNHKGEKFFNDCYVGVVIDWDGIIHEKEEGWLDTTNEIDLILMKGLIPVFISCKNGKIGEEELYKLNTVANRFGGKYAKKMLIATKLEKDSLESRKAYEQRAKDMGILLVTNARELTSEDWQKKYRQVVS